MSDISQGLNNAASNILGAANIGFASKQSYKDRMFTKEMAWQQETWNRENWERQNAYNEQYNSPTAQRQRLEDAGLNPYMMLDGGSAGQASTSPPQASLASQPAPRDFSAGFNQMQETIRQNMQMAYQSDMLAQQVRSQRLQNDMMEFDLAHQMENWLMDIDLKDSQRGLNDANAGLARAHDFISRMKMPSEVALAETAAQLNTQNAVLSRLNQRHQDLINKYLPQDKLYEYQDLAARAFMNRNQGMLNLWLAKNSELSYNQAKELNESYLNAMKSEYNARLQENNYKHNYWNTRIDFGKYDAALDRAIRFNEWLCGGGR